MTLLSYAMNVVHLLWVPGNAGIKGSELAERAEKEESLCNQPEADIDMKSAIKQVPHFTLQSWNKELQQMKCNKTAPSELLLVLFRIIWRCLNSKSFCFLTTDIRRYSVHFACEMQWTISWHLIVNIDSCHSPVKSV